MAIAAINGDSVGPGSVISSSPVTINGTPVSLQGDAVTPHVPCPDVPIHCAATMTASSQVTVDGIPICVTGDPATCGHSISGSSGVDIS